ncbi:MAG: circadian clock protein KaiA [Limnoraphis robusta]|uniref:Circadian clock oscillator protein KaiA n=1 Tax=Limnoraphis robusta CCNP1315 TaxID=3110306 RepID=A0ABU5U2L8_9CYAN|nr:circadian clock protein KaiA [Limnoraphis robusta]MEA5521438.1 circadian clock protein KaiA [Limnoraphis robusta CCNP1315]MEA5546479.1 circadian clock protein KaiA [Limnoraphis robusta CCNP1324]
MWRPQLSICLFVPSTQMAESVMSSLQSDRYAVVLVHSIEELLQYVSQEREQLDCLIVQEEIDLTLLVEQLQHQNISLPTVILDAQIKPPQTQQTPEPSDSSQSTQTPTLTTNYIYHNSEVHINVNQLNQINGYVDKAISQFITQAVTTRLTDDSLDANEPTELTNFIMRQQRRLAEKLHERLGYLGVYYKRSPQNFLRNLPPAERQELLDQLKLKYRQIVLSYFSADKTLNNKIDEYVNIAFFADVPVTRIVEIHMELMDNFSKQLKLEGRSEDVLLDYRLTLIDMVAHLCEMYRRSIPRDS